MSDQQPEQQADATSEEQYSVMLARFPYGRAEDPDAVDFMITTALEISRDWRVSDFVRWRRGDTPITMTRNHCLEKAVNAGVDFVLMVDSDMSPDYNLPDNQYTDGDQPWAKPFWRTSFDFAVEQRKAGKPCLVGAPYLGPSPVNNVYVFQWGTATNHPMDSWRPNMALLQFTREHAAEMRGITEVAALPTGLILIDMLAVREFYRHYDPPFFYYEYDDKKELNKASTEDVTFTRDLSLYGIKQYCNWDAWAGHWKKELVGGPPVQLVSGMLAERFRKATVREYEESLAKGVKLMDVSDGRLVEMPQSEAEVETNGRVARQPDRRPV